MTLYKRLCKIKAKKVSDTCSKHIGKDLLDVGARRCYIAKELKERNSTEVTCIDVKDLNETELNLVVYNGDKIPFNDSRFTTVLLAYVLHHCDDPLDILKECKRVCNGKIVIFEDKPGIFANMLDYVYNALHGVKTPFNLKTEHEWLQLFKQLNLRVVEKRDNVEKQWFYPFVRHTMFVLQK